MYPTNASPPTGIDFSCTDEDLFLNLERLQRGSSLPENVITDVNPFQHMPSHLPDGVWFFVSAREKARTSFGFWKIKGEACSLFSNQFITGWRTTFEYYEGQALTDWLMHEYWIVQRKIPETGKTKEASSLFRVFLEGKVKQNDQKMQKIVAEENQILSKQSAVGSENCTKTSGSTSSPQASKDEGPVQLRTGTILLDHHNPHQENVDESDYLSRGDFLELNDLDIPPSPASSSENSSCLTKSSAESFDSLHLLQVEHEINPDLISRAASCKSTTSAPLRLNEVVNHHPSAPLRLNEVLNHHPSAPLRLNEVVNPLPSSSVNSDKVVEETWNRRIQKKQPLNRPRDLCGDSSRGDPITDGEKKGKRAKNRYCCFMPF